MKLAIGRFGRQCDSDQVDWLIATTQEYAGRLQIIPLHGKGVFIDVLRNQMVQAAREVGADLLLMIDNDVQPDQIGMKRFMRVALEAMAHRCGVYAAPYCGAPPEEEVNVFVGEENDNGKYLTKISRHEAARMTGITEVLAVGCGLLLFDMRVFEKVEPPYFALVYNHDHTKVEVTEDVYGTHKLHQAGVPICVVWDCWAIHNKNKLVREPKVVSSLSQ